MQHINNVFRYAYVSNSSFELFVPFILADVATSSDDVGDGLVRDNETSE